MRPLPLQWRISLLVCVLLAVVVVTVSIVSYVELHESLVRQTDQTLSTMANTILSGTDDPSDPGELDRELRLIVGLRGGHEGVHYRIWREGGEDAVLTCDPAESQYARWLANLPNPHPAGDHRAVFHSVGAGEDMHRVIWLRHGDGAGAWNIVLSAPLQHAEHEMAEFLRMLLILGACVVGGSLIVGAAAVLWGLRPLTKTARRLERITGENIGRANVAQWRVPAELRPFTAALAALLARLDKSMRLQQQFTSDASHELRTPLASAKSTLQTARMRERSPDDYRAALDAGLDELDRMDRLISQLLALARMDASTAATDPAGPLPLDHILQRVVDDFARQAGRRVVCEPMPPTRVAGNEDQLVQLFNNLLSNAVRYGPADGVVRVSLRPDSPGGRTCHVCVHDDGGQIPPEAIGRLFDRFYRLDASRARSTGGAGLGLAIAREIVLRHGGSIEIASSPDAGTDVLVRLPVLADEA